MTKRQERTFDYEKQNRSGRINADFNANERRRRGKIDIVSAAEFADGANGELLHEIGAVSDAGDECCAGNFNATKR